MRLYELTDSSIRSIRTIAQRAARTGVLVFSSVFKEPKLVARSCPWDLLLVPLSEPDTGCPRRVSYAIRGPVESVNPSLETFPTT